VAGSDVYWCGWYDQVVRLVRQLTSIKLFHVPQRRTSLFEGAHTRMHQVLWKIPREKPENFPKFGPH
jgi:hypothetical protein